MKTMNSNPMTVANFGTTAKANKVNNVKTSTFLKTMAAAVILCGASLNAQAQNSGYYDTKDEVAVAVGVGSNSQIINAFSSIFSVMGEALISSMLTGGQFVGSTTYENEKDIPALSVEYFHHLSPGVSIGGIAAFNGTSSDMYCKLRHTDGSTVTNEKIGSSHKYYFSVLSYFALYKGIDRFNLHPICTPAVFLPGEWIPPANQIDPESIIVIRNKSYRPEWKLLFSSCCSHSFQRFRNPFGNNRRLHECICIHHMNGLSALLFI